MAPFNSLSPSQYESASHMFLTIWHWQGTAGREICMAMMSQHFFCLIWPMLSTHLFVNFGYARRMHVEWSSEGTFSSLSCQLRGIMTNDTFGPLQRANNGSQHADIIKDKFSKLTGAIPTARINSLRIAKIFLNSSVGQYGIALFGYTDNGS